MVARRNNLIVGPWANRRYQGADMDRLSSGFPESSTDINRDIAASLPRLRSRCRGLEQNNDLARRFLQLVETNIVGPQGFRLRSGGMLRNGKPDKRGNDAVEQAWAEFSRARVCDLAGRMSLTDLERLAIRGAARDGEALVRIHDIPEGHGIALELLDPTRLDLQHNREVRGTPRIVQGIELDGRGRAIAYHLKTEAWAISSKHERVSASQIIHLYRPERPEQYRGVPWLAASMRRLFMLGEFEDEALAAARFGARTLGFIQPTLGGSLADMAEAMSSDAAALLQSVYGFTMDDNGNLQRPADPLEITQETATFRELPPGFEVVPTESAYPDAMVEGFIRQLARTAAQGLGVSHASLTGDLTQVNFSSMRHGALDERENWMQLQSWAADNLMSRIFERWLPSALTAEVIDLPSSLMIDEALRRYRRHTWGARRWTWVDPLKDAQTLTHLMAAGLADPVQAAAQLGVDLEESLEGLAGFIERAKELGVPLSFGKIPINQGNPDDEASD